MPVAQPHVVPRWGIAGVAALAVRSAGTESLALPPAQLPPAKRERRGCARWWWAVFVDGAEETRRVRGTFAGGCFLLGRVGA